MKIKKLYTLSQFVEYLKQIKTYGDYFYFYVINYNDFLKQPLKKEMFFNDLEKPRKENYKEIDLMLYEEDLKAWQEAEKKVIFNGYSKSEYYINDNVEYHFNDLLLQVKTLSDLAEKTNGQLKLKNIEI